MAESPEKAEKSPMSKTLLQTGSGADYEKLKVTEEARPSPQKGEVQVNVKASGINFSELMCKFGLYGDDGPKPPVVLGVEGAGDIMEVGEGVEKLQVGDKVMCFCTSGLWREYATVPADQCFLMPEGMSYEEAAAIPANYVTAYHVLFEVTNLRRGQSVLVHMADGGVGLAATQLCHTVPDVTVFGTASADKHDAIRANGVDHPITDYKDYVTEVRKLAPEGVDIVLDPLAGDDSVKGLDLLKPFGKIIHYGVANLMPGRARSFWQVFKTYMTTKSYSGLDLMTSNRNMCGYHLGSLLRQHPDLVCSAMVELIRLYKEGKIKPKIDSVWAFEDIVKASTRMHDRQNVGKVLISPQKTPEEKAEV